jgi:hypothetical protein
LVFLNGQKLNVSRILSKTPRFVQGKKALGKEHMPGGADLHAGEAGLHARHRQPTPTPALPKLSFSLYRFIIFKIQEMNFCTYPKMIIIGKRQNLSIKID